MVTKTSLGVVDPEVLDRGNHTGTQSIETVEGLASALLALQKYAFRANRAGVNQTGVPSATYTKVVLGTEAFDTGGMYDAANSRVIAPYAGPIFLRAQTYITTGVATEAYVIAIYKNGALLVSNIARCAGTAGFTLDVSVDDTCDDEDQYEVFVNLAGAGAKTIGGTIETTFFSGHMI